jgi:TetR/AcrR family transcriptional repressor of mexJK operon
MGSFGGEMGTKERIMEAARELFEQKGFASATTKEIALKAGVSEVTLFRHFESKRSLFDETLHNCFHPYTVEDYLKNGVTYDLQTDLKHIGYDMLNTYKKNTPLIRMVMRDKIRESVPERDARQSEQHALHSLLTYFKAMKEAGHLNADPEMAMKFYTTNIMGHFFRGMHGMAPEEQDDMYFDWMLDKIISVLEK